MKLLIDGVNLEEIKYLYKYFPLAGVTSNPSLLFKENQNPYKILKEVREFIGNKADLHVQVISLKANEMVAEASVILSELGDNTYIKVPVTKEGLKAIAILAKSGVNVTGTTVYNQMQAYLAAKAGAKYVAPYVNRIDNMGYNGCQVVRDIQKIFDIHSLDTKILGASFKNSNQVLDLCLSGIGAVTAAPEIIKGLIVTDLIDGAVLDFKADFEKLCGKDKTMANCK